MALCVFIVFFKIKKKPLRIMRVRRLSAVVFDKLGLTDNENPFGVLPAILGRSMSRTAGEMVADYIGELMSHRRRTREAGSPPPIPQRPPSLNLHGGERYGAQRPFSSWGVQGYRALRDDGRGLIVSSSISRALLYTVVEDLLDNFGMDGKACLLRAICEVHGRSSESMKSLGVIGEMLQLFLTSVLTPCLRTARRPRRARPETDRIVCFQGEQISILRRADRVRAGGARGRGGRRMLALLPGLPKVHLPPGKEEHVLVS